MDDYEKLVAKTLLMASKLDDVELARAISKKMIQLETLVGAAKMRACEAGMAQDELGNNPSAEGFAFASLGECEHGLKVVHNKLSAVQSRYLDLPFVFNEAR